MKIKYHTIVPAAIAGAVLVPTLVVAIEPPADDAPAPAAVRPGQAEDAGADRLQAEPSAFAGVVTAELPEMLAAHLNLRDSGGIIVRAVVPNGPAAAAGMMIHDVITHIDGAPLASPEDLSREILARKPGEKVSLGLIHEGKPAEISIALGERPANGMARDLGRHNDRMLDGLMLDGMPQEQAQRLRGLIEKNLGGGAIGPDGRPMHDIMEDMKRRMDQMMENVLPEKEGEDANFQFRADATVRMMDENGSIEMKSRDGGKEVTLRDRDNEITWTGPWDTEQDKAAAPEDVRERVEKLNLDQGFAGKGFRFNFDPHKAADPRDE